MEQKSIIDTTQIKDSGDQQKKHNTFRRVGVLIYGTLESLLEKIKTFDPNIINSKGEIWGMVLMPVNRRSTTNNVYIKLVEEKNLETGKIERKFVQIDDTTDLISHHNKEPVNLPFLDSLRTLKLSSKNITYVICIAYQNKKNKMSDFQVGITGKMMYWIKRDPKNRSITYVKPVDSEENCVFGITKAEIGFVTSTNNITRVEKTAFYGNKKNQQQITIYHIA
jgi:hypothetical protein